MTNQERQKEKRRLAGIINKQASKNDVNRISSIEPSIKQLNDLLECNEPIEYYLNGHTYADDITEDNKKKLVHHFIYNFNYDLNSEAIRLVEVNHQLDYADLYKLLMNYAMKDDVQDIDNDETLRKEEKNNLINQLIEAYKKLFNL